MSFYLIRAESNLGPLNFPVLTDCHNVEINTIWKAVNAEAMIRGIRVSKWTAAPIDEYEFRNLAGING